MRDQRPAGDAAAHEPRRVRVLADMRWPAQSGIGEVQDAYVRRLPHGFDLVDLGVRGRIGSPLSPMAISAAVRRTGGSPSAIWSAGFVPPLFEASRSVVMVHDLTHLHYYGAAKKAYYDAVFRPLYRRCAAIVCVSAFTRSEFLEWSGARPEAVHMIHNGLDPRFGSDGDDLGLPPYVLYPGNRRSYKNLNRLISAYAASRMPQMGVNLLLTGNKDAGLVETARRNGVADRLHFAGRVAEADMPRLYRGARALAYVSLYEGFGLPIIEAMACGVPVVTSNVSAMPEVAGGAAVLVDPLSTSAIAAALDRVGEDGPERHRLIDAGLDRARAFDWDRSAQRLWHLVGTVGERLRD